MPDDPNTTPDPNTEPASTPEPSTSQGPQSVAVQTPQTTASATPNTNPDPQQQPSAPPVDIKSVIPEAYKDKPYMQQIDSFEKLFQDFDNAQSLIGQRQTEVPGKDASEEEVNAFLEKIRPESQDAYEFPETEFSKKFGRDEQFQGQMKELFHKAGLMPHQVKILTEGYDNALFAKANETAQNAETQAADFEKLADGFFGDKKDEKLKIANEILKANTPDQFKEHLGKLSNENLMIMSSVLNNVFDKFMKEDDLNIGGKGTATDASALQEEARQLMARPEYKDFRHPKHDETVNRVNELYDQIGKMK